MSTTPPEPAVVNEYDLWLLIPHPTREAILLLPDGAAWTLPMVRLAKHDATRVMPILQVAEPFLGVPLIAVRPVLRRADAEDRGRASIFAFEPKTDTWNPPAGSRWVDPAELETLPLTHANHREPLQRWFAEEAGRDIPPQRAPWAQRGWFATVARWIEAQLDRLGLGPLIALEQERHWGISALLRARTERGEFYFKAVPPFFAQEAGITALLGRHFPRHTPQPIAVDRQGWMLLADFGNQYLWKTEPPYWEQSLQAMAQLQQGMIPHQQALLAAGALDRRLEILASQVDPFLADPETMAAFTPEEVARLQAIAPRLKALCADLASYQIPQTLVHGDLHANNIVIHAEAPLIFDWTDACVAHPFFDLCCFVDGWSVKEKPDLRAPLCEVYLSTWTAYEPLPRLYEAFEKATILSCFHQGISYQMILANLERLGQAELASGVTFWIRHLLKLTADWPPV